METNIRQDNNEEVEIDIMQIIRMLLSKIWIVIVAGVATAIVCIWNNRDSNYTSVPVIHQIIYNQQTEWHNNNT